MRRSNSWWACLGDASSGSTSGRSTFLDLRDPNPPPRLITIEESQHSNMSDSPEFKQLRAASGSGSQDEIFIGSGGVAWHASLYGAARHAKSVSSLQTANTETLEWAEGSMAIAQRDSMMDSQTTMCAAPGDDFRFRPCGA
ncbi:hypothetical protein EW146_g10009 [Bondarzewia mesenterica]|uniref:Uncharacterized protein n=1 Tax=Bondarzewia mesenterica TaxID=1095465 RepID=A0A4S4L168_9AGAM|nr:hypothetical protein EW146_g10009 [Bondarzewia mesenterica]